MNRWLGSLLVGSLAAALAGGMCAVALVGTRSEHPQEVWTARTWIAALIPNLIFVLMVVAVVVGIYLLASRRRPPTSPPAPPTNPDGQ